MFVTPCPRAAAPYLRALLSAAPAPIKCTDGRKFRRARSLPPPQSQCFQCLASYHHVAACREPVRCRSCLRYGHQSFSCSMAGSFPRSLRRGAQGARRQVARPSRHRATPRGRRPLTARLGSRQPSIDDTGVECRRRAAVEVLWPMDRAVDGDEGQPGPELGPGGSCGVHSWIEGASGDGRRVSWFAPQNQGGGRRLKIVSI